ncbi:class I adenylate-forming enzyme family protein [Kocuria sp. p3-SID1433]|uniref:class I adenylate-forming enzyme family protein n=1 Tax=Kocuria sp. p3-SID1433 TaxID=2916181 RepID=UPI0028835269|nr:class I adenylate-forming enzyme family protein [Kocuria sp. p3-SID1433]
MYPQEIEAVLALLPGVADVVVTGVPDPVRGQRVVAGVLPSPEGVDRLRLRAGLAGRLALAKRPQQYLELQELPLTGNGKLSRQLLCKWILEGDNRVRGLADPAAPCWCRASTCVFTARQRPPRPA